MPRQKVDEEHIITQSLKLFRQKSYHATSMADIAKACGLLKGSLYHYFDGKEDLMRKVISTVYEYFKAEVFSLAYQTDKSGKERLTDCLKKAEDVFVHRETGQVMGNLGVESAFGIPEFSPLIRKFFEDFFDAIKHIYMDRYEEEIAAELAERSVAEVEGSIMLSRIFDDPQYLKNTNKRLIQRLEKP